MVADVGAAVMASVCPRVGADTDGAREHRGSSGGRRADGHTKVVDDGQMTWDNDARPVGNVSLPKPAAVVRDETITAPDEP